MVPSNSKWIQMKNKYLPTCWYLIHAYHFSDHQNQKYYKMLIKWILLPMAFAGNCWPNYTGRVSTTKSGRTCQRWDKNYPHQPKMRPNPSNHNYCRNPNSFFPDGPWCYTTDRRRRAEYCDIKAKGDQN